MKKQFLFFMLLALVVNIFAQPVTTSPPAAHTDYLKKSRHQKMAAHLLLWGGMAISITGQAIVENDNYERGSWALFAGVTEVRNNNPYNNRGDVIETIGILSSLGSIPLFIVAHRNKKKAINLSFKTEKVPYLMQPRFLSRSLPVINLKINI